MAFIQMNIMLSISILVFCVFSGVVPGFLRNLPFLPPDCNSAEYISLQFFCTKEIFPVCGTDGNTYINPCVFCVELRNSGGRLQFSRYFPCWSFDGALH